MKKSLLTAAVLLMVSLALHGQEVRRALPVQSVAADDLAKFLAGVALGPGSPLAPVARVFHVFHACGRSARLTRNYDRNYFSRMRAWSATELAPRFRNLPVYYFSGDLMPSVSSHFFLMPPCISSVDLNRWGPFPHQYSRAGGSRGRVGPSAEIGGKHSLIWPFHHEGYEGRAGSHGFPRRASTIYMFISLAGGEVISTRYVGVGSDGTLREYGEPFSGSRGVLPGVQIQFLPSRRRKCPNLVLCRQTLPMIP